METKVVNLRHESCDVRICRPEILGNPFYLKNVLDNVERDRVVAKFKVYFDEQMKTNPKFREAVEACRGRRIGCFCKPKACHGDVIKEWLDNNPPPCDCADWGMTYHHSNCAITKWEKERDSTRKARLDSSEA